MRLEHLVYFKDLIEGRAHQGWRAWWKQHEEELASSLPRARFLELNFKHLHAAERLLQQHSIPYTWSPQGRREAYFATLSEDVLDESGRPRETFLRGTYSGAGGAFLDGDQARGNAILTTFVRNLSKRGKAARRQVLEEMVFDAETALLGGSSDLGRALLEAVAGLPLGDDLTDFAVSRARALLLQSDTSDNLRDS